MNNEPKNGIECSEFEALLAEALDNALAAESRQGFEADGRSCQVCGPLWADAQEGMLLVRSMEDLEPPRNLMHNILAATSRKGLSVEARAEAAKAGWLARLRGGPRPSFAGLVAWPFASSLATAFFSPPLSLPLAG